MNGRALHFYLAGINNQNFLMRDKETGTWWQQITGKALYGPLQGASLELVPSDEISFGQWKSEVSNGRVLAEVPKYIKEYDSNWEPEVAKLPVVISFPGTELKSRDVVVGLQIDGPGRAYPWDTLVKQSPVMDHVQGMPLLVAVGPDAKSFRVFVSRIDGKDAEFFLKQTPNDPSDKNPAPSKGEIEPSRQAGTKPEEKGTTPTPPTTAAASDTSSTTAAPSSSTAAKGNVASGSSASSSAGVPQSVAGAASPSPVHEDTASAKSQPPKPWILIDSITASEWNFQGCAISGPAQGKCLDRINALKDYWFDWRNYHPQTTIYKR